MVEISVVRKLVNFYPWNRKACFPAFLDWSKTRAIVFNFSLTVAIDTSLGSWDIRMACNLHKTVAIAAIHTELLHMNRVRKRNRLVRLITDARVLRSEVIPNSTNKPTANDC